MKGKRGLRLLILLLFLFLAGGGGCGGEKISPPAPTGGAAFPLTLTDGIGRQVTIPAPPEKIVSLAPSCTEILFALGLGEKVVGVTTYCNYPPEAQRVDKVGTYSQPSLEKVASLAPDLVLGDDSKQKFATQFENLGIPFLVLVPRTIPQVLANIKLVGEATGKKAEAEEVCADFEARLAALSAKLAAIPEEKRLRVYYEVYPEPLMSAGPGTFIHQIITLAGGKNIAADAATDWPEFSAETVAHRNPQVIVFPKVHGTAGVPETATTIAKIRSRPGWEKIDAVKSGKIYGVDPDLFSRPTPRLITAAEELARLLYPELFSKEVKK